jgi:uncharacterized protein (TIGR03437 family)
LVVSWPTFGQTYTINTVAGNGAYGFGGDGGPATSAKLWYPTGVAVDFAGNLYIADMDNNRIRKVTPAGTISTVAGNGTTGPSGDNGPAAGAQLNQPSEVAVDSAGNLYIADTVNNRIRKVTPAGIISTVAGNGTMGFSGDNGPATSAQLSAGGVAVDSAGNLYIADPNNNRIRKVSNGVITTVAGNGARGYSGDGGPATNAMLSGPVAVTVDSAGNLYIADSYNNRIREVSNGMITTVAAGLNFPSGVAVDFAGNLYITDTGNFRIRKVSNGVITTVAGNGTQGFSGDGGPATSAELNNPAGISVDSVGNLYIADTNNFRVRVLTPSCTYSVALASLQAPAAGGNLTVSIQTGASCSWTVSGLPSWIMVLGASSGYGSANVTLVAAPNSGTAVSATISIAGVSVTVAQPAAATAPLPTTYAIYTVAGNGTQGYSGDNGPAMSAELAVPYGIAVDSAGNLYIGDQGNLRIRRVFNGAITTVAGSGACCFSGDNGPAASAELDPTGVALDSAGNLYIADTVNNRIRKVSNGVITTVAGGGTPDYSASLFGDNGPATNAILSGPVGVAVDSAGSLYIADSGHNQIRRVSNGVITTAAGTGTYGTCGFSGDGGLAISAELCDPTGVAVDAAGNLYIADERNNRIRKVSNGLITTVAGTGTPGFSGDNGPATSAQLNSPIGVAVDAAGNLYIDDDRNDRIREVSNGVITSVAGNGTQGFSGDNGPATSAQLDYPSGVAVDSAGNVYIADEYNSRIRVLTPVASPSINAVTNAASYVTGAVSPGELVTVFGTAIGPATAAYAATDTTTGKLATTVGGVQVLFNFTPAPMIYASSMQVSAVVPYEMASVAGPSVWIKYLGQTSYAYPLTTSTTAPGLFTQNASGSGPGAILNQDNSVNGPGNRAAKGSIVQLFLTGEGQTSPPSVTGAITTAALPPPQVTPAPVLAVGVTVNGQPALYVYAGEAPGLVAGMMQLNVQIPANAPSGDLPILVSIGGNTSQKGVTVSVQ